MRTPAIAAALVAAALIIPATAAAKEIKDGSVCGADGCVEVTDKTLLMALVDGGGISSDPPQAGPFYEVTINMAAEGHDEASFTSQMVPSRRALRGSDGTWMELPVAARHALDEVVGDNLKPLPAAELVGAAPATAPVRDAPAADPRGLSTIQSILVLGGLVLIAAGFIAVGRGHRPTLRRRPGAAPSG